MLMALIGGMLIVAQQTSHAQTGAIVASGNWDTPSSWSTGVVPSAGTSVNIGSTTPAGAVSSSTISLTQNQSASSVLLGNGNGTSGTVALGNFDLTASNLTVGASGTGVGAITRGTGKLVISGTVAVNNNSLAFGTTDTTSTLNLNGATAATAAQGNVTANVTLSNASTLTLNSNLNLSSFLQVTSSTVNANNNNIAAANGIYLYNAAAQITNRGSVTTPSLNVTGSTFNVGAADAIGTYNLTTGATTFAPGATVTGALNLTNSTAAVRASSIGSTSLSTASILTVKSGQPTGLTVTGTSLSAITINDTSKLRLELDGNIQGWVLRWANPGAGNHVADLNALTTASKIDFTVTNGGQFQVVNNLDGFTYIYQPVPEPATTLLVAVGGLASAWSVRRRRLATV